MKNDARARLVRPARQMTVTAAQHQYTIVPVREIQNWQQVYNASTAETNCKPCRTFIPCNHKLNYQFTISHQLNRVRLKDNEGCWVDLLAVQQSRFGKKWLLLQFNINDWCCPCTTVLFRKLMASSRQCLHQLAHACDLYTVTSRGYLVNRVIHNVAYASEIKTQAGCHELNPCIRGQREWIEWKMKNAL